VKRMEIVLNSTETVGLPPDESRFFSFHHFFLIIFFLLIFFAFIFFLSLFSLFLMVHKAWWNTSNTRWAK